MQHALGLEKEIEERKMALHCAKIVRHLQANQLAKEKEEAENKHEIKKHRKEKKKKIEEATARIQAKETLYLLKRNEDEC